MNKKCSFCGNNTLFVENPYNTPGATKFWKSTFDKPDESLFILERKTPSVNRKGKMTVKTTNEYVLAIYCSAQCGLDDYEQRARD